VDYAATAHDDTEAPVFFTYMYFDPAAQAKALREIRPVLRSGGRKRQRADR